MIIKRWLAPIKPNKKQIESIFQREELEYFEEVFKPGAVISDHRHPFDEIRIIVAGELFYNIAGNKILLRQGDRIIIPANTQHSKTVQSDSDCVSICAFQAI